jgi:hypothetical protein
MRMRWVKHVARMVEVRNVQKRYSENLKVDSHFGHVDIQGSVIFSRDFKVTINGIWIGNRIC